MTQPGHRGTQKFEQQHFINMLRSIVVKVVSDRKNLYLNQKN